MSVDSASLQVEITSAARQEIRRALDGQGAGVALRVFVNLTHRHEGDPGTEFGLALDTPKGGDEVLETGGIRLVVDERTRGFLEGGTIDFQAGGSDGGGFRITSPHGPTTAAEPCTHGGACG